MEARPVDAKMITRRCIVARLQEVSISKYRDLIQENAGALLVLLPSDLTSISKEDKQVSNTHRFFFFVIPGFTINILNLH